MANPATEGPADAARPAGAGLACAEGAVIALRILLFLPGWSLLLLATAFNAAAHLLSIIGSALVNAGNWALDLGVEERSSDPGRDANGGGVSR